MPELTDEQFHRLLEAKTPRADLVPAPSGGWQMLKVAGGILASIITAGLTGGMFWLIGTANDNKAAVQRLSQQIDSDKLLADERLKNISITLTKVEANTNDRFTRNDFLREIVPMRDDIKRNTDSLDDRTSFITETRERLTKLENQRSK